MTKQLGGILLLEEGPMAVKGATRIEEIPLNKIKLAKNSRTNVTDNEISGLMSSIKETGLLQPIGVVQKGNGYEVVYGNRRFLAVSKLGYSKIPATIHQNKTEAENDLQNLTENLQRRNITLTEAGRYMEILNKSGLTIPEIAIRLGVNKSYITACLTAYNEIPEEFKGDIEVRTTGDKGKAPGKISVTTARNVISAGKSYGLTKTQVKKLLTEAKSNDKFNVQSITDYATAIKNGDNDPVNSVSKKKHIRVQFWMNEKEHDRLHKKYIVNGQFTHMNSLYTAILRGEISEHIKCR